jgi:hypothetical protein
LVEWDYCLETFYSATPSEVKQLHHFCYSQSDLPATKLMLPKLIALAKYCHDCDKKMSQWYCGLLNTIKSHFMTEGSCLFFGDAKKILNGEIDYTTTWML